MGRNRTIPPFSSDFMTSPLAYCTTLKLFSKFQNITDGLYIFPWKLERFECNLVFNFNFSKWKMRGECLQFWYFHWIW